MQPSTMEENNMSIAQQTQDIKEALSSLGSARLSISGATTEGHEQTEELGDLWHTIENARKTLKTIAKRLNIEEAVS